MISRRSATDAMLNRAYCGPFEHGDNCASLTRTMKVCSQNRKDLEAWRESTWGQAQEVQKLHVMPKACAELTAPHGSGSGGRRFGSRWSPSLILHREARNGEVMACSPVFVLCAFDTSAVGGRKDYSSRGDESPMNLALASIYPSA
jgi:hypothetical protein